jgi:signal transduction histidine kinase
VVAEATILVVDDNAENRALACATLEDEGYRAITANDGEQAVAAVAAERPDCVLMDVRMPKLDGIAACERIRKLPGGDQIAIIFVTAQREVETFDRALAAGGDDFMTKPFRPGELVVRVQTAMRLRRIARERGELYDQLKQQRDALQRLELQKEQLVGFLVHDLKNPVGSIELSAQALERHPGDAARTLRAAGRIRDETRALLRMITNLLDISKADEGRLAPRIVEVDVGPLVAGVLQEASDKAAQSSVTIATEISAHSVRADRDLMSRVLANLIDNAIRYAPEGSQIQVLAVEDAQGVEMRVADRGPGVPADQREAVFERFLSSGNTERSNRGLGLAFCKIAVEAHGGRIWIEDGAPGAVFCVRI